MSKHYLLSDDSVQFLINHASSPTAVSKEIAVALALEIREYRRAYGRLGCDWLESDLPINPFCGRASCPGGAHHAHDLDMDPER
jgi:hypothetical protein